MTDIAVMHKSPNLKDSLDWLLGRDSNQPAIPPIKVLDLGEALEWLLGRSLPGDEVLSAEEKDIRQHRRLELLMWMLNLERRLPPYGEEQLA